MKKYTITINEATDTQKEYGWKLDLNKLIKVQNRIDEMGYNSDAEILEDILLTMIKLEDEE